ncbi:MAG: hypothetical protein JWP61_2447 [Friedmanniella sp.]|nr:hypothetical protein [Friedmanniella sp.]
MKVFAPSVATLAIASALVIATAAPASAADPDFTLDLAAGLACAFPLRIQGSGDKRIMKEFTNRNGDVVRLLAAGKGFDLTFTNLTSGGSISVPGNGSVQRTTINADGTQTVQDSGHNVVILFPTDVPAGPSTTLYTGHLVYTVDASGVFTVRSTSGRTSDFCELIA